MVAAGVALAAIFVVPYLELMSFAGRTQGMDLEYATSFSLEPERLAAFVFPFLFGGSPWAPETGAGSFAEMSPYVGLLPLTLAGLALTRRNPRVVFLAALACAGLVLALGSHTPLGNLVFDLPVLRTGRAPARFLLAVTFRPVAPLGFRPRRAPPGRRPPRGDRVGDDAVARRRGAVPRLGPEPWGPRVAAHAPRPLAGWAAHRRERRPCPVVRDRPSALVERRVAPDALVRLTLGVAAADLFFFAASLWGTYNAATPPAFYADPSASAGGSSRMATSRGSSTGAWEKRSSSHSCKRSTCGPIGSWRATA
jgi:hypothetical protein